MGTQRGDSGGEEGGGGEGGIETGEWGATQHKTMRREETGERRHGECQGSGGGLLTSESHVHGREAHHSSGETPQCLTNTHASRGTLLAPLSPARHTTNLEGQTAETSATNRRVLLSSSRPICCALASSNTRGHTCRTTESSIARSGAEVSTA